MRTTNPNESSNSHIWRCAPQTSTTVETYSGYCSGNGVLEFNKGSSGFISVLNNLSIFSGHHFMIYISIILPQVADFRFRF